MAVNTLIPFYPNPSISLCGPDDFRHQKFEELNQQSWKNVCFKCFPYTWEMVPGTPAPYKINDKSCKVEMLLKLYSFMYIVTYMYRNFYLHMFWDTWLLPDLDCVNSTAMDIAVQITSYCFRPLGQDAKKRNFWIIWQLYFLFISVHTVFCRVWYC